MSVSSSMPVSTTGAASLMERCIKGGDPLRRLAEGNFKNATFSFPGSSESDVSIDVYNGRSTTSCESNISSEHKDSYVVREKRYGKFARTLQLSRVSRAMRTISMSDGVLTVIGR
ncbi:uncharacterized protein BT62DRAFT_226190 [Guyanagaster necrorhizus]|uniref:SHSP domain-containing protein n=1 Tax=Guyanagaster necrorhizus TaxID=856835 RepID=A0A9P7VP26_9AGAR|nr:uncharacterized protein BT62DRAFT_226190 [Guyanagaster necrorhizus MCA 3950]KAG7444766.1 hypothetical protein BT62DRAFT_226190 [Guyanagaster necrorhizus MCA 3950]